MVLALAFFASAVAVLALALGGRALQLIYWHMERTGHLPPPQGDSE